MTSFFPIDRWMQASSEESLVLPLRESLISLGIGLFSWILAELTIAPALHSLLVGLWIFYIGCFFIFTAWYFRSSRLFQTPWTSYKAGIAPLVWALWPLHLMLPAALITVHLGFPGILMYEIGKACVIVSVLSRTVEVLQKLNAWPRWGALLLMLSPLAVAFGVLLVVVLLGSLGVMVGALSFLKH